MIKVNRNFFKNEFFTDEYHEEVPHWDKEIETKAAIEEEEKTLKKHDFFGLGGLATDYSTDDEVFSAEGNQRNYNETGDLIQGQGQIQIQQKEKKI